VLAVSSAVRAGDEGPAWKSVIAFPDDSFQSWTSPAYIKFTIITKDGYDPNVVYYQDSRRYAYHYDFALEWLDPFVRMTIEEFDRVTLHAAGQQAVLGAVVLPPWHDPPLAEYGIQLVRQDAYSREEVVRWLSLIRSTVEADPNVAPYYFPAYEQYPTAQQNREWFADRGIRLGSTAQWTEGNAVYSSGWALGTLRFVVGSEIQAAYTRGELTGEDVLLTDGVPAEVPSVAGIVSLMPGTPNSHVAILAQSQGIPFVHLAVESDAAWAQQLVGLDVYLAVNQDALGSNSQIKLLDASSLDDEDRSALLALKKSPPLAIEPMKHHGQFWADTNDFQPSDINYFGGKAANFGVLRRALPNHSPRAMAFSFDLWNAFLNQAIAPVAPLVVAPGEHVLLWADGDPEQGPCHLGFKLDRSGEVIGLFDRDGVTLIDAISFGSQPRDVSYGRVVDGGTLWQFFETPTPGRANAGESVPNGLVINEFMADNERTVEDPDEAGEYADWIELYNGTDEPVTLSGLFLTDDLAEPTKWQIPVVVTGPTLRDEIASRLAKYTTYPPADMKALVADLAAIRSLLRSPRVADFGSTLESVVLDALHAFGFDSTQPIRFRSSTNVEDSDRFTGAGLYESYSGRLFLPHTIFGAIRDVFASFYDDNAFLERFKYGVDESQVGMALLVHHSFPDDIELANGVATMKRNHNSNWNVEVVSQKGAISVTNPPTDALPEIVRIDAGFWGPSLWVEQRSSLVPLRDDTVLASEDQYLQLYDLLVAAAEEYCRVKGKDDPVLDLEYKKVAPDGKLVVKQIREIPQPETGKYDTPFLLGQPAQYCILQGRGSDVFTSHRLKSRWTITPKGMWLSEDSMRDSIYDAVALEYVAHGQVRQVDAATLALAAAGHALEPPEWEGDRYDLTDNWRFPDLCNPRTYRLRTTPMFQATLPDPIVTLDDLRLDMEVDYDVPVPLDDRQTANTEDASLYVPWEPTAGDVPEECLFDDPNTGVFIHTLFRVRWRFWGFGPPTSVQFVQTRIEGLTTEPIVLTDFFSQSVGGGSHLCPKNFLFEPGLEPGISPQILAELKARNIRLIYYTTGARECRPTEWEDTPPMVRFYGFHDPIERVSCNN
jgi:hypothetical protein